MGGLDFMLKLVVSVLMMLLPACILIRDWKFHDRRTKKYHNITRYIIILWVFTGLLSVIIIWTETSSTENLRNLNEQILMKQDSLKTQNQNLISKVDKYQEENESLKDELAEQREKTFYLGGKPGKGGFTLYSHETALSRHLETAIEYYKNNDLTSAQHTLHMILQKDPDHIGSLNLLGIIQNEFGNSEKALEYLNRAYTLSKNPDILENIDLVKKYRGRRIETRDVSSP